MRPKRVLYQGLLRSPASWARVGRGYLGALARMGITVDAVSPRGFLHDEAFPLPGGVREITPREAHEIAAGAPGIGFLHPPCIHRLLGTPKVNLFVWEADRVPPTWPALLRDGSDRTVVPSSFTRAALVASGHPADRIAVAPYGHDGPSVAHPPACRRQNQPFTFLAIVSPHHRKGIRELLHAYRQAFSGDDDVLLRIKTTYDPASSTRKKRAAFEIPGWRHTLQEAGLDNREGRNGLDTDAPPVDLRIETLPDSTLATVYADVDVCVQPSRGESFGLVILEALAMGIPTLATAWGGHLDFFPRGADPDDPVDDLIPFRLARDDTALYHSAPDARIAIADVDALAARMRWHREHPERSRQLGEDARARVAHLTWTHAAQRLIDVLDSLM